MLRWTSLGVLFAACAGGAGDADGPATTEPLASAGAGTAGVGATASASPGAVPVQTDVPAAQAPPAMASASGAEAPSDEPSLPDEASSPNGEGAPPDGAAPAGDTTDAADMTDAEEPAADPPAQDGDVVPVAEDSAAVDELAEYLAQGREQRPPLAEQGFAQAALSQEQAEQAADLLWQDRAALIAEARRAEHEARVITLDDKSLRYDFSTFGDAPPEGRSLFISLHGGGNAEPSVNDQQWENQKVLYQPEEGIYLSPRAPTDTWNLWHEAHIDPMFARLITNFVVLENVNPDRVYVMGYSAGGDGVYQLGPRMADYWAAAAAMAGHPNEAQPLNLRNIGFTVHVGALDTGFDRNLVAQEWSDRLDELQASDPEGYAHVVEIHEGKPHWMDLEDAVAVPWMAEFTRNTTPDSIVWFQDDITHPTFYWLAVEAPRGGSLITARVDGQHVELSSEDVTDVWVRLNDELLDLDQPVTVSFNGVDVHTDSVTRSIVSLARTLDEREDPRLMFSAEIKAN